MDPLKREFIELFEASGWNQAELGRKLKLSRGGVNGIVTGDTIPSKSTLQLLKFVLYRDKPEVMKARKEEPPAHLHHEVKDKPPDSAHDIERLMRELEKIDPWHRQELVRAFLTILETQKKGLTYPAGESKGRKR